MCGDFLFGTLMFCCLPCISKRDGHHTAAQDQGEAPRPVKLQLKGHVHNAEAIEGPSRRRVSGQQAHRNLVTSLEQPANGKQTAALCKLRMAFATVKDDLSPEFFPSVITDLDTVLFGGYLNDRTVIEWTDLSVTSRPMLQGVSKPCSISRSGISKVRIRLNKALFVSGTKEEIWGTVVHEMLHAYMALTSGWSSLTIRHHGPRFEESCQALVVRLALYGFEVHHVV
jgi:hypothetical protein